MNQLNFKQKIFYCTIILGFLCFFLNHYLIARSDPWYHVVDQDNHTIVWSMEYNSGRIPFNNQGPSWGGHYLFGKYLKFLKFFKITSLSNFEDFAKSKDVIGQLSTLYRFGKIYAFFMILFIGICLGFISWQITGSKFLFALGFFFSSISFGTQFQALMLRMEPPSVLFSLLGACSVFLSIRSSSATKKKVLSILSGVFVGFAIFTKITAYPFLLLIPLLFFLSEKNIESKKETPNFKFKNLRMVLLNYINNMSLYAKAIAKKIITYHFLIHPLLLISLKNVSTFITILKGIRLSFNFVRSIFIYTLICIRIIFNYLIEMAIDFKNIIFSYNISILIFVITSSILSKLNLESDNLKYELLPIEEKLSMNPAYLNTLENFTRDHFYTFLLIILPLSLWKNNLGKIIAQKCSHLIHYIAGVYFSFVCVWFSLIPSYDFLSSRKFIKILITLVLNPFYSQAKYARATPEELKSNLLNFYSVYSFFTPLFIVILVATLINYRVKTIYKIIILSMMAILYKYAEVLSTRAAHLYYFIYLDVFIILILSISVYGFIKGHLINFNYKNRFHKFLISSLCLSIAFYGFNMQRTLTEKYDNYLKVFLGYYVVEPKKVFDFDFIKKDFGILCSLPYLNPISEKPIINNILCISTKYLNRSLILNPQMCKSYQWPSIFPIHLISPPNPLCERLYFSAKSITKVRVGGPMSAYNFDEIYSPNNAFGKDYNKIMVSKYPTAYHFSQEFKKFAHINVY